MPYTAESDATLSERNYPGQNPSSNRQDIARYPAQYDSQQLDINRRFYSNLEKWKEDTADISSTSIIINHAAYKRMIGLGLQALPLIFLEMQKAPDFWFDALRSITGINDDEDPVRPEDRGNLKAMTIAWLDWATRNEYV